MNGCKQKSQQKNSLVSLVVSFLFLVFCSPLLSPKVSQLNHHTPRITGSYSHVVLVNGVIRGGQKGECRMGWEGSQRIIFVVKRDVVCASWIVRLLSRWGCYGVCDYSIWRHEHRFYEVLMSKQNGRFTKHDCVSKSRVRGQWHVDHVLLCDYYGSHCWLLLFWSFILHSSSIKHGVGIKSD